MAMQRGILMSLDNAREQLSHETVLPESTPPVVKHFSSITTLINILSNTHLLQFMAYLGLLSVLLQFLVPKSSTLFIDFIVKVSLATENRKLVRQRQHYLLRMIGGVFNMNFWQPFTRLK